MICIYTLAQAAPGLVALLRPGAKCVPVFILCCALVSIYDLLVAANICLLMRSIEAVLLTHRELVFDLVVNVQGFVASVSLP